MTPGHALLPSSARKSVRGRFSSGAAFETPVTKGNHWDVIEGDIEVPTLPEAQGEGAQVEDCDEIEYMPPTAIGESADFVRVSVFHRANMWCRSTIHTTFRCA
jgi:hypothetical protein